MTTNTVSQTTPSGLRWKFRAFIAPDRSQRPSEKGAKRPVHHTIGTDAPPMAAIAIAPMKMRTLQRPRRTRALVAVICAVAGLILALDAGWIHAKATLAQVLLERAWIRTAADGGVHRPWPWADTRPVARLSVPRLERSQIVLAGDSGRTLAFGPGWAEASAPPNTDGVAVISGHRDTHFAWLKDVLVGDVISVDNGGSRADYLVTSARVVDSDKDRIDIENDSDVLLLVTCWPFDAVAAGGPMRYVVTTRRVPVAPHAGLIAQR